MLIHLQRILALNETQTATFRIWTRVTVSNENNQGFLKATEAFQWSFVGILELNIFCSVSYCHPEKWREHHSMIIKITRNSFQDLNLPSLSIETAL